MTTVINSYKQHNTEISQGYSIERPSCCYPKNRINKRFKGNSMFRTL